MAVQLILIDPVFSSLVNGEAPVSGAGVLWVELFID